MRKELSIWQLGGATFTVALGTVLHFLYGWTGSILVTPFSAVNESTWEHMKLLFFPMLIFACVQYCFFCKEYQGFWWIKLVGILIGLLLIPILFYTLSGIFGTLPGWVNVLLFFVSVGGGYYVEYILYKNSCLLYNDKIFSIIILSVITLLFIFWTYAPPRIPLFIDPLTGIYGIIKKL